MSSINFKLNNGMLHLDIDSDDLTEIIKNVNTLRRRARHDHRGWYTAVITMANGTVCLKGYDTWLQRIEVAPSSPKAKAKYAFHDSGPEGISAKLFNEQLTKTLAYIA